MGFLTSTREHFFWCKNHGVTVLTHEHRHFSLVLNSEPIVDEPIIEF